MSKQPLSKELRDILNIIADLCHNNTKSSIKDNRLIEETNHLPSHEVTNYLDELESRGVIVQDIKAAGTDFRNIMITREGINTLKNQDIK